MDNTDHTQPRSVLGTIPLGPQWSTIDPFLFCAHHDDDYPEGNGSLAPNASLGGRAIGQDFSGKDGWSMYHGSSVPGFPQHPHRGFETITFARRGLIDHSDSLGATARFGRGDVQWMTAGSGVVHSEMFPLVNTESGNHTELFQVWLNLPSSSKMVDPHFTMLWAEEIPIVELGDRATVTVIAGTIAGVEPPTTPPSSWAADPTNDVALWHLVIDDGGSIELPPALAGSGRVLYCFTGSGLTVDGSAPFGERLGIQIDPLATPLLHASDGAIEILVMQGQPINEPVAQYGPFVMNTEAEIRQAFDDYQRTSFGGWPWADDAPHHGSDKGRFAIHADGRQEQPEPSS